MKYFGDAIEDEDGQLLLQFPVEMLSQMGWCEGTLLEWMIDEEQNVILKEPDNGRDDKTESV